MRTSLAMALAALGVACAGASARTLYSDPVGDLDPFFLSQGFNHLDLVSIDMTNDATNLYVKFSLNGDIAATNWGKYCMLIDAHPGGVSVPSNPWGRNINTNTQSDYWLGSWVDGGGGAQLWKNNGVVWDGVEFAATYLPGTGIAQDLSGAAGGFVSYSIALSNLGVNIGDTIFFDAIATAGGTTDPGVDHLSLATPATPDWGTASTTGEFRSYTLVPAPGTVALLGLGGLAMARRRR